MHHVKHITVLNIYIDNISRSLIKEFPANFWYANKKKASFNFNNFGRMFDDAIRPNIAEYICIVYRFWIVASESRIFFLNSNVLAMTNWVRLIRVNSWCVPLKRCNISIKTNVISMDCFLNVTVTEFLYQLRSVQVFRCKKLGKTLKSLLLKALGIYISIGLQREYIRLNRENVNCK